MLPKLYAWAEHLREYVCCDAWAPFGYVSFQLNASSCKLITVTARHVAVLAGMLINIARARILRLSKLGGCLSFVTVMIPCHDCNKPAQL